MREHFEKLFKNELSPDEAREFLIDLYIGERVERR